MKPSQLAPLSLLLAAFWGPGFAVAADVGEVKKSKGSVLIERAGGRVPAVPGTKVREADVVVTGADGAVGMTFADHSLVSLGPNSTLSIDRFVFDTTTHKGVFESTLRRGTLVGASGKLVKQTPESMRVRTPTALLGVRGTKFGIDLGSAPK